MRVLRAYKKTVSIVEESTIGLYEAYVGEKQGFLLESYDKNNGRYSIFGKEPEEIIRVEGACLSIKRKDGTRELRQGNPIESLRQYFNEFKLVEEEGHPAFSGGLTGCFAYDFIRYSEKLPDDNPDETGIADIELMLATQFIVIDHAAEIMTGVVLEQDTPEGRCRGTELVNKIVEDTRSAYSYNTGAEGKCPIHDGRIVKKSDTLAAYREKVEKIKEFIVEGHIFQTVLSQRWTIDTGRKGFDLYKELRILNPSPYLYYFNFGDFEVIGSSPEMLVKQAENKIYTCPIAGTRQRGRTPQEDERIKEELLADEKERAEHVMLVDLARNDMGRIAEVGTVKVTRFMDVQNYSHVMHLVSLVEGKSAALDKETGGCGPVDLLASFLPAGTLSGAPKIRAMEIIDELEDVRRGLYGGATGYLAFNGNLDFCITIRTMIKRGRNVYIQAGAGIVLDSVPEKEYEECCNKVMALANTLMEDDYDIVDRQL